MLARLLKPSPPHPRRLSALISPRRVLARSGQSLAGTVVAVAAILLYAQDAQRNAAADELTTLASSAQSLFLHRLKLYEKLARLPRGDVSADALHRRSADVAVDNVFSVDWFGRKFSLNTLDISRRINNVKTDLENMFYNQIGEEGKALIRIISPKKLLGNQDINHQIDPIPFSRPTLEARIGAWLIDSAFVGLLASTVSPFGLYGSVACLAWLFRDYLLAPLGMSSPGYRLMGLEKIHVETCQKVRPDTVLIQSKTSDSETGILAAMAAAVSLDSPTSAIITSSPLSTKTRTKTLDHSTKLDLSELMRDECMSMLGHNTLRFFTYCSSLGPISSLASLGWCIYAFANGIEETVHAWDKFTGIRVVYTSDVSTFASTGIIRDRANESHNVNLAFSSHSDDLLKSTKVDFIVDNASLVKLDLNTVTEYSPLIQSANSSGDQVTSDPKTKLIARYVNKDGKETVKELTLPNWINNTNNK